MLYLFSRISTWLFVEMLATCILIILNMIIPILMMFTSYRNIINFYFSSTALSSSLINCLYLFYLIQTLRSKVLSELNCRAIYYLQTSCVVVLAYTVITMQANFVLCLFPTSDKHHRNRTCLQAFGHCLRRFFQRLCFCLVLGVWSLSFTATIPLLYTIDSNEKSPKPVYCPGTTQISYLEEWFDRNRFTQTVLFNLIPLVISLLLTLIALMKLFYDFCFYIYLRLKMSKCSPCRKHRTTSSIEPCGKWFSTLTLRFLLVISCCLLACVYPIVMRFYIIYFSILVPLIFTALNYSLGQLPTNEQSLSSIEDRNTRVPSSLSLSTANISKLLQAKPRILHDRDISPIRPIELENLVNENRESTNTPSSISTLRGKQQYVSNNLYENTRSMFPR